MQLHPGDLGWHWRFGAEATAAAVRTWSRGGQILAVGLLDSPVLLRLAIAPEAQHDEELAQQMAADVTQPERDVLPAEMYTSKRDSAPCSEGCCSMTGGTLTSRGHRYPATSRSRWRIA